MDRAGQKGSQTAEEREFVAALRRGDRTAFDRVYDAHHAAVYRFLLRLTRRRDLSEDLCQETWIRLARRARVLDEDTRLVPWLFTVARNLYLSHRRNVAVVAAATEELAGSAPVSPATFTAFDELAATETQRRLEEALARLPEPSREVILLVAVEQLSHADAADVIGLRPDAFRQRLARARTQLEEALAPAPRIAIVRTEGRRTS